MNNFSTVSTKQIAIIISILFIIIFLFILSMFNIVIISGNSNDSKEISIKKTSALEYSHVFSLKKGSKMLILPKGEYAVDARSGNMQTTYGLHLGGFSIKKLPVTTKQQRLSSFIGVSAQKCAIDNEKTQSTIYFPCDPNTGETVEHNGTALNLPIDSIDEQQQTVNTTSTHSENISSVIKPYLGGVLQVYTVNNTLFARQINGQTGTVTAEEKLADDYSSILTDTSVITSPDVSESLFGIYEEDAEAVRIFQNLPDTEPNVISLPDTIKNDKASVNKLYISKKYLYSVYAQDSGILEYHDDTGDAIEEMGEEMTDAQRKQRVIIIDIQSGEIEQEETIKPNDTPRLISANASGDILFAPKLGSKQKSLLYLKDNKLQKKSFPVNDVQFMCWKDTENLYYSSQTDDNVGQIFEYSAKDNASYLVYENSTAVISSLHCNDATVYFTLSSDDDGLTDEYPHYKLTNTPSKAVQLENILPLYIEFPDYQTTVKVEQYRTGVKTSFLADPTTPIDPVVFKNTILENLKEKGVDISAIEINN